MNDNFPAYQRVLEQVAQSFYSKEPNKHELGPQSLVEDLRNMTKDLEEAPRHLVWSGVQNKMYQMMRYEYRRSRSERMDQGEMMFLSDLILHVFDQQSMLKMSYADLKKASSMNIASKIKVQQLQEASIPSSIWLEFSEAIPHEQSPWIRSTIGLLISRLSAYDAPLKEQQSFWSLMKNVENNDNTFELFKTLVSMGANGTACYGLTVTVVQTYGNKLRFYPFVLGHELVGSVKEMLVLHKETTINDRRKRKDMEQVWANVAARLLLLSDIYQWFNDDQQVVLLDDAFSNINSPSATLFLGKKKQDLQIRPRRQGDQVFKIEN